MLSVIMVNVIMLSVVMLSVVTPILSLSVSFNLDFEDMAGAYQSGAPFVVLSSNGCLQILG